MRLSIITPTLNSAQTVRDTFESIKPLVRIGAEHIIVDSGSEDTTLEIAANYDCKVLQYPKGNMYEAINFGIRNSTGHHITYINSDDILYSDNVARLLKNKINGDLVYGSINFIDLEGNVLFTRRPVSPNALYYSSLYFNPIFQQGLIFTRAAYERLGGFNEDYRFSSDMDFVLRAIYSQLNFQKKSAVLAAFRISDNQLSSRLWSEMKLEGPIIREKLNEEFGITTSKFTKQLMYLVRASYNVDQIFIGQYRRLRGKLNV